MEESELVTSALASLAAGDVDAARASLVEATSGDGNPLAHELLGGLQLAADDIEAARASFEAAFREWRAAGRPRAAALVAATLADLHTSWLGNRMAGRGWIARARRLLEREGRCVEQGYVELALIACDADDAGRLAVAAATALELALEFDDRDLEVRALADSGFACVVQGRLDHGFELLDEAMAALSAGEVRSPGVAATSFCALLAACDRTGDVARAEEWTRVVATAAAPRALHTHCRLVYGSVLCTAGRWPEGEAALLEALGPGASTIRIHRAEAAARLATLRLMQGRVDEAAELLRPFEDRVGSCEALARVHLAKGEHELAEAVARRGLAAAGSDCLRAGALLSVLVEIEVARDDLAAAAVHADALAALGGGTDCRLVRVDAAIARARVAAASADAEGAAALLVAAQQEMQGEERPHLAGVILLELSQAVAERGERGAAVDHARAALGTFERLGATPMIDRANALLRSLGAPARSMTKPAAAAVAGLTAREQQVLALVREGLTNPEIGERLFISAKTAEHHVGRVLAKLGVRSRAEAAAIAGAASPSATPDG